MRNTRQHLANRCFFILALALFLDASIGCTYISHPLSDEKTSVPDLSLLGKWKVKETENNDVKIGMLVIDRKPDSPNVLTATLISGEGKRTFELLLTKIGDDCLASYSFGSDPADTDHRVIYGFSRYEITSDGKIAVSEMDDAVFAEAIKRHELKGFQKEGFLGEMVVDETPENICHFIKDHADKIFPGKKPLSTLSIERIKQE
jgi:hypothetical protein